MPVPTYRQPPTHDELRESILNAFALPYRPITTPDGGILEGEEEFIGKSKLEVIVDRVSDRAAMGDMEAVNFMFDRTIGKPKQHVESVSVAMSYQDFLKNLTQEDGDKVAIQAQVIQVDGVSVSSAASVVTQAQRTPLEKEVNTSFLESIAEELEEMMDGI